MKPESQMTIGELAHRCHTAAVQNGWWTSRYQVIAAAGAECLGTEAEANIRIAALGLICQEAGEAMENVRAGYPPDDKLPDYAGYEVELADVIIRALDLCGEANIPIGTIIERKLAKNAKRGVRHGGKTA